MTRLGGLISAVLLVLAAPSHALAEPSSDPAGVEFFESKIRPLLSENCYKCHSAGAEKLKGSLHLDTRAGILKGGESGTPVVTPKDPEASPLIVAVRYEEESLQMPPK